MDKKILLAVFLLNIAFSVTYVTSCGSYSDDVFYIDADLTSAGTCLDLDSPTGKIVIFGQGHWVNSTSSFAIQFAGGVQEVSITNISLGGYIALRFLSGSAISLSMNNSKIDVSNQAIDFYTKIPANITLLNVEVRDSGYYLVSNADILNLYINDSYIEKSLADMYYDTIKIYNSSLLTCYLELYNASAHIEDTNFTCSYTFKMSLNGDWYKRKELINVNFVTGSGGIEIIDWYNIYSQNHCNFTISGNANGKPIYSYAEYPGGSFVSINPASYGFIITCGPEVNLYNAGQEYIEGLNIYILGAPDAYIDVHIWGASVYLHAINSQKEYTFVASKISRVGVYAEAGNITIPSDVVINGTYWYAGTLEGSAAFSAYIAEGAFLKVSGATIIGNPVLGYCISGLCGVKGPGTKKFENVVFEAVSSSSDASIATYNGIENVEFINPVFKFTYTGTSTPYTLYFWGPLENVTMLDLSVIVPQGVEFTIVGDQINELLDTVSVSSGAKFSITAYSNSKNITLINSNFTSVTVQLSSQADGAILAYNNIFNASAFLPSQWTDKVIYLNTTKRLGSNIVGGPYIGGNYWIGFSETCADVDRDGICDDPYVINENETDYLPLATPPPNSPPTVTIYKPSDGQLFNTSFVAVQFVAEDDFSEVFRVWIESSIDGIVYENNSYYNGTVLEVVVALSDGQHTLTVYANDTDPVGPLVGQNSVSITVDTLPPHVTIVTPADGGYYNTTTIDLTYVTYDDTTQVEYCWFSLDGSEPIILQNCNNITLYDLAPGYHEVTVYANDTAGNVGSDTNAFYIDIYPPTVVIFQPANGSFWKFDITLNYTATDNESGIWKCWYSVDNSSYVEIPGCVNTTFSVSEEGWHTVTVRAQDVAGNIGDNSSTFFADITPPNVTIQYPTKYDTVEKNVDWLNFTVEDNGVVDTCWYRIEGEGYDTGVIYIQCENQLINYPTEIGKYYNITVCASDKSGNENCTTQTFFRDKPRALEMTWDRYVPIWYYQYPGEGIPRFFSDEVVERHVYIKNIGENVTNITIYKQIGYSSVSSVVSDLSVVETSNTFYIEGNVSFANLTIKAGVLADIPPTERYVRVDITFQDGITRTYYYKVTEYSPRLEYLENPVPIIRNVIIFPAELSNPNAYGCAGAWMSFKVIGNLSLVPGFKFRLYTFDENGNPVASTSESEIAEDTVGTCWSQYDILNTVGIYPDSSGVVYPVPAIVEPDGNLVYVASFYGPYNNYELSPTHKYTWAKKPYGIPPIEVYFHSAENVGQSTANVTVEVVISDPYLATISSGYIFDHVWTKLYYKYYNDTAVHAEGFTTEKACNSSCTVYFDLPNIPLYDNLTIDVYTTLDLAYNTTEFRGTYETRVLPDNEKPPEIKINISTFYPYQHEYLHINASANDTWGAILGFIEIYFNDNLVKRCDYDNVPFGYCEVDVFVEEPYYNNITVISCDTANNCGSSKLQVYATPDPPPEVTLNVSETTPNIYDNVTINVTATDTHGGYVDVIRIYINDALAKKCIFGGITWANCTYETYFTAPQDINITAEACDTYNDCQNETITITVIEEPPSISIYKEVASKPCSTSTVGADVYDDGHVTRVEVYVDGSLIGVCEGSYFRHVRCIFDYTETTTDAHTLLVKAWDDYGHVVEKSTTFDSPNTFSYDFWVYPSEVELNENIYVEGWVYLAGPVEYYLLWYKGDSNPGLLCLSMDPAVVYRSQIYIDYSGASCASPKNVTFSTYVIADELTTFWLTVVTPEIWECAGYSDIVGVPVKQNVSPSIEIYMRGFIGIGETNKIDVKAVDSSGLDYIKIYVDGQEVQYCDLNGEISYTCTYVAGPYYSEGLHEVYAVAADLKGNTLRSDTYYFQVSDKPVVDVRVNDSYVVVGEWVEITVSAYDSDGIEKTELYIDGYKVTECYADTCTYITTFTEAGTHILKGTATDTKGVYNEFETVLEVHPPESPPEVTISLNDTNIVAGDTVEIVAYAESDYDIQLVEIYLNGTRLASCPNSTSCGAIYTFTTTGIYEIFANATDVDGRTGNTTLTVEVYASDVVPPEVTVMVNNTQPLPNEVVYISVSASDDSGVNYTRILINGTEIAYCTSNYCSSTYIFTTEGIYNVTGEAADPNGNVGYDYVIVNVSSARDAEPPKVDVTSPARVNASEAFNVSITASDNVGLDYVVLSYKPVDAPGYIHAYTWDVGGAVEFSANYTFNLTAGNYTIRACAYDLAGNGNCSYTDVEVVGVVVDEIPPYVEIYTKPNATEGETLNIYIYAEDNVELYRVQFLYKKSTDLTFTLVREWYVSGTTFETNYTYQFYAGNYTLRACAEDTSNNVNCSDFNITVYPVYRPAPGGGGGGMITERKFYFLRLALDPTVQTLMIFSETGDLIFIRDVHNGEVIQVPEGTYTFVFTKEKYKPNILIVDVYRDQTIRSILEKAEYTVKLILDPETQYLVVTDEKGNKVYEGFVHNSTVLGLDKGVYTFEFSAEGYQPEKRTVEIKEDITLVVTLSKKAVRLGWGMLGLIALVAIAVLAFIVLSR